MSLSLSNYGIVTTNASGQYVYSIASTTNIAIPPLVFTNKIYKSSDYGGSFSLLTNIPIQNENEYFTSITTNSTGQYIFACTNGSGYLYQSADYGSTWICISDPNLNLSWVSISCNDTYVYACCYDQYIYYLNYSTSFTGSYDKVDLSSQVAEVVYLQVTGDNNIIYIICNDSSGNIGIIYKITNITATTPTISLINNIPTFIPGIQIYTSIVTNYDGTRLYALSNVTQLFFTGSIYKLLNDTLINTTAPIARWSGIACSSTGQYVYASIGLNTLSSTNSTTTGGTLYKSSDYGNSWSLVLNNNQFYLSIATNSTGQYVYTDLISPQAFSVVTQLYFLTKVVDIGDNSGATNITDAVLFIKSSNYGITWSVSCFLKGSRILTTKGYILVENLKVGDEVITKGNIKNNVVSEIGDFNNKKGKIKWLGYFTSGCNPICFKKDCFGINTPMNDLYVSPDHGIIWKNRMLPAKKFINNKTIYKVKNASNNIYYHIELDKHSAIISEGILTESYLETNTNRYSFTNQSVISNYFKEPIVEKSKKMKMSLI
jgi:hypothetical protein